MGSRIQQSFTGSYETGERVARAPYRTSQNRMKAQGRIRHESPEYVCLAQESSRRGRFESIPELAALADDWQYGSLKGTAAGQTSPMGIAMAGALYTFFALAVLFIAV